MPDLKSFADVNLFEAVGHWHPLILHLPIGLLIALVLIELRLMLQKDAPAQDVSRSTIVALLAITGPLAALTGWMLHEAESYGPAIEWHEYLGIATGIASLLLAGAYWKQKSAYRPLVFLAALLMSIAGHLGANITHGENFVLEPWLADKHAAPAESETSQAQAESDQTATKTPSASDPQAPANDTTADESDAAAGPTPVADAGGVTDSNDVAPDSMGIYNTTIQPILDQFCIRCHGEKRQKEGLRLYSYEGLLAGSDWGSVVTFGNAAESKLIESLRAPLEEDEHMPPSEKPQPTQEQIAAIAAWIDSHSN